MTGNVTPLLEKVAEIDRDQPLPFSVLHADDAITLILYTPKEKDLQEPHDQDEYYFVASGAARIRIGEDIHAVAVGDAIFVPAWAPHRFEDASPDFACWALFYGPRQEAPEVGSS